MGNLVLMGWNDGVSEEKEQMASPGDNHDHGYPGTDYLEAQYAHLDDYILKGW
ncbi:hypothetical protein HG66A1_53120 [Gimesia chilikensis]|uniref:Uncharacterized protein n=1 Tax=Gimesia chilikensis TaxID=2605989 RepID=A0A517PVU7_9PLAN|nr:hypothetical protein HG66A1_53120 [Gimesia chilikensis]